MTPAIIVLSLCIVATVVVMMFARKSKSEHDKIKRRLCQLSIEEARNRWLAAARDSRAWAGEFSALSLHGMPVGSEKDSISFTPAGLEIGNSEFNPPKTLEDIYRIIGIVGNEDFAWICCRKDGDTIWELDGTERTRSELDSADYPSIFHYLLFVDIYFKENSDTDKD